MTIPKLVRALAVVGDAYDKAKEPLRIDIPSPLGRDAWPVEVSAKGDLIIGNGGLAVILTPKQAEALARGIVRIYELDLTKGGTP